MQKQIKWIDPAVHWSSLKHVNLRTEAFYRKQNKIRQIARALSRKQCVANVFKKTSSLI